jgi:hypothetical protein
MGRPHDAARAGSSNSLLWLRACSALMAVRSGHYVTTRAGRFTAAAVAARLPRRAWQRLKTGQGSKGASPWRCTAATRPGC